MVDQDTGNSVVMKEKEQVKQVKRHLEGWREVLLPLHSVLIWEKPYYPGILAGMVTFVFLVLWYTELSVLTTMSVFGIVASILDYTVPIACRNFFDPDKWTGTQESRFEEICRELVQTYNCLCQSLTSLLHLKETSPKVYFVTVLCSLIMAAWIGNMINNLLLTYLTVLSILLFPGMKHNGIINHYVSKGALALRNAIKSKEKKN